MKKLLLIIIMCVTSVSIFADNASDARKILDKAAAVVGNKSGAQASFTISSAKLGKQSGTISIKGSKFCAVTPNATMWYNGKTQWTYMKSTNEVNVSTPSAAQQQKMNPYSFINLYKAGYKLSVKAQNKTNVVHMTKAGASIPELYITVNSANQPTQVRMRQGNSWTTIVISNFRAKSLSDKVFQFNSKDYPSAEVIDLR